MKTIRFTDETKREEGLRIIVLNGPVEYTEIRGVYRIPNYMLSLLDESSIPYEVIKSHQNAGQLVESSQ